MTWAQPITDLRTLLADGVTDKRVILKQCVGQSNGTNDLFITFEIRRLTTFTGSPTFPLGVYVDGQLQVVTQDDPVSGAFKLSTPPAVNKKVEASYYSQWFTDAQLTQFLVDSGNFMRVGGVFMNVPQNLQHAALKYAASEAYQYLSLYWARQTSEAFRLNDAMEKDRFKLIESYAMMSKKMREEATTLRDDIYERGGQQKQPLWGFS